MNAPDIIFLSETKNPDGVVMKELKGIMEDKYCMVSPHSPGGGGLLLTWKKDIDITIRSTSHNFIDTSITNKRISFHATFVYGEPDHSKRIAVWNTLADLHPNANEAWFLTGDFNEIVDNNEKSGGPERSEGSFCAF